MLAIEFHFLSLLYLRTPYGPNQLTWRHILASLKLTMTKINGRAKCQTNQSQLRAALPSRVKTRPMGAGQGRADCGVGQGRRSCRPTNNCKTLNNFIFFAVMRHQLNQKVKQTNCRMKTSSKKPNLFFILHYSSLVSRLSPAACCLLPVVLRRQQQKQKQASERNKSRNSCRKRNV